MNVYLGATAAMLLLPAVAVVALLRWARWARRQRAGRFVVWTAHGLAALAGLVIVTGIASGVLGAGRVLERDAVEPSAKARMLASGIAEAMNRSGRRLGEVHAGLRSADLRVGTQ